MISGIHVLLALIVSIVIICVGVLSHCQHLYIREFMKSCALNAKGYVRNREGKIQLKETFNRTSNLHRIITRTYPEISKNISNYQ